MCFNAQTLRCIILIIEVLIEPVQHEAVWSMLNYSQLSSKSFVPHGGLSSINNLDSKKIYMIYILKIANCVPSCISLAQDHIYCMYGSLFKCHC